MLNFFNSAVGQKSVDGPDILRNHCQHHEIFFEDALCWGHDPPPDCWLQIWQGTSWFWLANSTGVEIEQKRGNQI